MPRYHNRDGASFHFTEEGEGPAVLLLHGVGSNLNAWDLMLPHLTTGRRYIRPDLRGHGASARLPGPYTLKAMAQDVMDLVAHCELRQFAVIGFSLGGLIAQQIALDHPDRLRALGLLSTVAGRTEEERRRVLQRRDILQSEGPLTHLANAVDRWFTDAFIAANPDVIATRRQQASQNDPDCYMAAYEVLAENDLGDQLHQIITPTLVMTGENDIGSNTRMARYMQARIKEADLVILDELKHSILLEAPDRVAASLNRFLGKHIPTLPNEENQDATAS